MKSQEIQSLLALGPEALSKQQGGSYTGLLFCEGKTSPWRAPLPVSFPLGSSMKEEIGPGLGRKGESVFIWEEPGVFLINRRAWETVVTISRKPQEVGEWEPLSPESFLSLPHPSLCLSPGSPHSLSPGHGTSSTISLGVSCSFPAPSPSLHLFFFSLQLQPTGRGLRHLGRLLPATDPQLHLGHDRKGQGRSWGSRRPGTHCPPQFPSPPPHRPLPSPSLYAPLPSFPC